MKRWSFGSARERDGSRRAIHVRPGCGPFLHDHAAHRFEFLPRERYLVRNVECVENIRTSQDAGSISGPWHGIRAVLKLARQVKVIGDGMFHDQPLWHWGEHM